MSDFPAAVRGRLPLLRRNGALPLGLLLLALAAVFVFGNDRSQFYRDGEIVNSPATMAVAANLSPEHGFLAFVRQKQDPNGAAQYVVYSRFPFGYVLVKLAILPFGDDFPRAIRAARLLMLACFAAAAALAYLALARLLGDRRIALAATLLACSSYYLLHYSDTIHFETSPSLLGVMLAFHGMTVFALEGRYRQLLVKTAAALLLGWHAAALIAPFVLLALGRELVSRRADGGGDRPMDDRRLRPRGILVYGAFSALCCALLLGLNAVNEYRAPGGEIRRYETSIVGSMLGKIGPGAQAGPFLQGQLGRIGLAATPFAAAHRLGLELPERETPHPHRWFAVPGAAMFAACLAGLRFLPHRILFAALLLAHWCWAVAFTNSHNHVYPAMFHLGIPLVFWSLVLLGLRRAIGPGRAARALPAFAAASMAVFALSAWDMGRTGHGAEAAAFQREATADFRAMRPFATGRTVLYDPVKRTDVTIGHIGYWLHGSYLEPDRVGSAEEWARAAARHDFVVSPADLGGSLTPRNRRFHLYRPAGLAAAWASLAAREPDARSAFEVRLDGRALIYTRDECSQDEVWPTLFVQAVPLDANDLPPDRRAAGFEDRAYFPGYHGLRFGGRCAARIGLPDYPLAGLRTGQRQGGLPPIWEVSLPVEDASFPRGASTWREDATASEPALRGPFGVYRDGRTLTYVREDCAPADTEDRFFVHVHDSGGAREALDFWFHDRGVRFGGVCMASVDLPGYEVRSVRTGQYDATGHLWDEEFALDAEEWLARFEAAAASEPALRAGGFGLHVEGRALTFRAEDCGAEDIADRFFVHAYAADGGGRENLDFWFRERGLRHGDRCMATVELPEHAVARVVAGQHDGSGPLWEADLAVAGVSR